MHNGFTAAQITLRTGHKNVQSVQPYANILGEAGQRKERSVLGSSSKTGESKAKCQKVEIEDASSAELGAILNGINNYAELNITINVSKGSDNAYLVRVRNKLFAIEHTSIVALL